MMTKEMMTKIMKKVRNIATMIAVEVQAFCMLLICLIEADMNVMHVDTRSDKEKIDPMIIQRSRRYGVINWIKENICRHLLHEV